MKSNVRKVGLLQNGRLKMGTIFFLNDFWSEREWISYILQAELLQLGQISSESNPPQKRGLVSRPTDLGNCIVIKTF